MLGGGSGVYPHPLISPRGWINHLLLSHHFVWPQGLIKQWSPKRMSHVSYGISNLIFKEPKFLFSYRHLNRIFSHSLETDRILKLSGYRISNVGQMSSPTPVFTKSVRKRAVIFFSYKGNYLKRQKPSKKLIFMNRCVLVMLIQ